MPFSCQTGLKLCADRQRAYIVKQRAKITPSFQAKDAELSEEIKKPANNLLRQPLI